MSRRKKTTSFEKFSIAWAKAFELKAQGQLSSQRWTFFEAPRDENWQHYAAKVQARKDGLWIVLGRTTSAKEPKVETNKLVSINFTKLSKNKAQLNNIHHKAAA
jgi:hypothetical protein